MEVDDYVACGLMDANAEFEAACDNLRSCNVEITTQNFRLSTNCTLRSLYAVVAYMCLGGFKYAKRGSLHCYYTYM